MNGFVLDVVDAEAYELIMGSLEQGKLDRDTVDGRTRDRVRSI